MTPREKLLAEAAKRILMTDGAFGTEIQNWKLEFDFGEDAKKAENDGEPVDFSGQASLGADGGTYFIPELPDAAFTLQGQTGVSAVPEPATWAMLIIGFGAVGMAARRQRSHAAA